MRTIQEVREPHDRKPGQVLDAPHLRPEPRRKLQKPSHPIPLPPIPAMLPKGEVIGKNISRTCASWTGKQLLMGIKFVAEEAYLDRPRPDAIRDQMTQSM